MLKDSSAVLTNNIAILREHGITIIKAVLFPLIILTAIDSVSEYITNEENLSGPIYIIIRILIELIALFQYTYVAVCTHRIVILGKDSVPEWGLKKYTSREGIFLFYSIVFMVAIAATMIVIGLATQNFSAWVIILPMIIVMYFTLRLSLIFPATAIDNYISLKQSWHFTHNKFLFLFMSTMVGPMLLIIPAILLVAGITFIGGSIFPLIGALLGAVIGVISMIIFISALSLAYLHIVKTSNQSI